MYRIFLTLSELDPDFFRDFSMLLKKYYPNHDFTTFESDKEIHDIYTHTINVYGLKDKIPDKFPKFYS